MDRIVFGAGRIGRLHYLLMLGGLSVASSLLWWLTAETNPDTGAVRATAETFVGGLALAWLTCANATRRAHDRNDSGWLIVLLFLPLVNVAVSLYLLFAPSFPLANRHGPPPEGLIREKGLDPDAYDSAVAELAANEAAAHERRNQDLLNDDGTFDFDGLVRPDHSTEGAAE